jgi:hypothetical protein
MTIIVTAVRTITIIKTIINFFIIVIAIDIIFLSHCYHFYYHRTVISI